MGRQIPRGIGGGLRKGSAKTRTLSIDRKQTAAKLTELRGGKHAAVSVGAMVCADAVAGQAIPSLLRVASEALSEIAT